AAIKDSVRIFRPSFPGHAYDRSRRRIDLQTPLAAALARDAAEGIDTHVSDLGGRAIDPTPEFSVQNYSSPDTCSERYANDRLAPASRALPHLTDGRGIRVVLEKCRQTKLTRQRRSQSKSIQTR